MKALFLSKIFIFIAFFSSGQQITFQIEKIEVFKSNKSITTFSSWDFHKPNMVTSTKIINGTKDTIRFEFEPSNCYLNLNLTNKTERIDLNYAYHNELDGFTIFPESKMELQLMWHINDRTLSKMNKKVLIKKMQSAYITIESNNKKIVSSKTNKIFCNTIIP